MTFPQFPDYKIALLNCYLQGGHTATAEMEAAKRLEIAASNLGISVKIFARSEDLYGYQPDIVICHAYQDAKLTPYPTYGTLTMPTAWVKNMPRFVRNILSYDGYITISESVTRYVEDISATLPKKIPSVFAAFSVPATDFKIIEYGNAYAAYLGTNWDGSRHGDFFGMFENSGLLKCFGPEKNWAYLHRSVYGHPVSFDGSSVLKVYGEAGIGLCFNHKDFDSEGIPTSRMFEIPASSALMIAGNNSLIKSLFGDSALYLDPGGADHKLADQVKEAVLWVRSHPKRAAEMAQAANKIFNDKLSMERMLINLIEAHEKRLMADDKPVKKKTYSYATTHENRSLTLIYNSAGEDIRLLQDFLDALKEQEAAPQEVVVVRKKPSVFSFGRFGEKKKVASLLSQYSAFFTIRSVAPEKNSGANALSHIRYVLPSVQSQFVAYMQAGDEPFAEHFSLALAYAGMKNRPVITYSGVVEYSSGDLLSELMDDDCKVPRKETRRLAQFTPLTQPEIETYAGQLNPGSMIFPTALLEKHITRARDTGSLIRELGKHATYAFVPYVTLKSLSRFNRNIPFFHLPEGQGKSSG